MGFRARGRRLGQTWGLSTGHRAAWGLEHVAESWDTRTLVKTQTVPCVGGTDIGQPERDRGTMGQPERDRGTMGQPERDRGTMGQPERDTDPVLAFIDFNHHLKYFTHTTATIILVVIQMGALVSYFTKLHQL